MGQRGRNRNGYYIALLHVLELQYERESIIKGSDSRRWQPSPQNRPDQFLHWVLDVLQSLNFPPPRTLDDVCSQLESGGLHRVAQLLERTLAQRDPGAGSVRSDRPLSTVIRDIGQPTRSLERHPQVRKFSKVIVQQLDADWRRALESTALEFDALQDVPKAALLLGALPPSFAVLNDYILGRLADCELVSQHRSLTVLQFYGLVGGTLPEAPLYWRPAIEELTALGEDDLLLLASLSDAQVRQLRDLGEQGWTLLRARLRLHLTSSQWRSLGESLAHGSQSIPSQLAIRLTSLLTASDAATLDSTDLGAIASTWAWHVVADLDEELVRLMARGELSQKVVHRLQRWGEESWARVRTLLLTDRDACLAFLEDRRILQELFVSRTGAHLHLRDLFPRTMSWLDGYLEEHLEDALLNDVGELETAAAIVSRRLQEKFWAGASRSSAVRRSESSRERVAVTTGNFHGID